MPGPSASELRTILLGTEHGGNPAAISKVTLAVPNAILGTSRTTSKGKTNNSGFSFGTVQLDIGVNPYAQQAYRAVLDKAVADGVITSATSQLLDDYIGVRRPDLDPSLKNRWLADKAKINMVFEQVTTAHEIIGRYEEQYLTNTMVPSISQFLADIQSRWGANTIFSSDNPAYGTALAAITADKNRTGNLNAARAAFLSGNSTMPTTVDQVKAFYRTVSPLPGDWALVEIGAYLYDFQTHNSFGIDVFDKLTSPFSRERQSGTDMSLLQLPTTLPNATFATPFAGSPYLRDASYFRLAPAADMSTPDYQGYEGDVVVVGIRQETVLDGLGRFVRVNKPTAVIANLPGLTDAQRDNLTNTIAFSSAIGGVFGSTLGRQLGGSDPFQQEIYSGAIGALSQSVIAGIGIGDIAGLEQGFKSGLASLPDNLKSAGLSQISSLLTAQLVSLTGLHGVAAGLANSVGNVVITQVVTNLANGAKCASDIFAGVADVASIANAVGSYLGVTLASKLVSFDTVGGQIGAQIGSSIGGLILPGFVGSALGYILGGLIGSLFGGTPRAGADVVWDDERQQFDVANVWSRKGGSASSARSLAAGVADTYNGVLAAVGGRLLNPETVQGGNYGSVKKDFVYRAYRPIGGGSDKGQVTAKFSGKSAAGDLLNMGRYHGLADISERLAGGDVYVKRALAATLADANGNKSSNAANSAGSFDVSTLSGNIQVAQDWSRYRDDPLAYEALIRTTNVSGANTVNDLTAGWTATVARAVALGLNKRNATDWVGGFATWLDEKLEGKIDGNVLSPALVFPIFDPDSHGREFYAFGADNILTGALGDTVANPEKTIFVGTPGADQLAITGDTVTLINTGTTINGVAGATGYRVDVAAAVDGGDGDDRIDGGDLGNDLLGGLGDDTLVGGRLDDWLIGGDGNDRLFAGAVTASAFADSAAAQVTAALAANGGSGNYLDGGAGDDRLYGATSSDWLVGGDGADILYGGEGGDILDAGKGNEGTTSAPAVQGGGGSDQYVFNRGDGQDVYFDEAGGGVPGATTDSVSDAVKRRSAGTLAKNWAGAGEFTVDGSTKGGEDAIAFGAGITMFDLLLERSGTAAAPVMDLIIKVQRPDGTWQPGDDQITIKDWFESTRKIEWLRFANGEEIRIGDFTSFQKGTAGADVIIGTAGNDFQYGGDGNDNMWGLTGNDWQVGGRGNDAVRGNDDNDVVLGGDDDDVALGGIGNDVVSGDDGQDRVYGGTGDDLVIGGRGDDEVAGGAGNDIFKYQRGDGRDTLYDEFAGTWELVWQNGAYTNGYTVDANGRVTKGGVTYNDGTIWVGRYDYNEQGGLKSLYRLVPPASGTASNVNSGTDTLEFGIGIDIQDVVFRQEGNDLRIAITRSGASIDMFDETADQIRIKDWYAASPAGKSIEKFEFVNTGEQLVSAMNLVGGTDDADTITALSGTSAWITGGAGDDAITGTQLGDILNGSSGTDTITALGGSDVLFGGDGDDVLNGGGGADVLLGGSGSDTASYAGATSVTVFLDPTQGTSTGDAAGDTYDSIENLTGSTSADILYGDTGDNILDGGLYSGQDTLYGGAGNDTYILNASQGTDTIIDRVMSGTAATTGAAGDDTVEVGPGVSLSNLQVVRTGVDLEIRIGQGSSNKFILKDFYATAEAVIENLVFADGLAANLANVRVGTEAASADADLLFGTAYVDTLSGLAGNDVISGWLGNDTLNGGEGDDVLEGGAGADTLDGGTDTITVGGSPGTAGNGDTIRYAGSSAYVAVDLATRAVSGGTGSEAVGDTIVADANGISTIENVTGSGYADSLAGDARANILIGLAGADMLSGAAGDDVLIGGDDADVISGGDGADNIDAGDGDDVSVHGDAGNDLIAGGAGNDTLWGDGGSDTIDGGLGNDTLWGGTEDDTLGGGDGADTLNGEAGNDKLAGGAGNDTLAGGDGNDVLSGDAGDDALQGGLGDDVYAFDGNAGIDSIVDASGTNRILVTGVTKDQVWLTRSGDDLKIGVIGGTTRVTVTGFFAATTPTLVREIATADASIFLKYAGGQTYAGSLIEAMTAASATVPASTAAIPAGVASVRDGLWWTGGKAVPQLASQAVTTVEDTTATGAVTAVDHDENIASYGVATQATNGSVTVNAATGAWSYTPKQNSTLR